MIAEQQVEWISPPSETLKRIKRSEPEAFSTLLAVGRERNVDIPGLLSNQIKITENIAMMLEEFIGSTQSFWLERTRQYEAQLDSRASEVDEAWVSTFGGGGILAYLDQPYARSEYGESDTAKILNYFAAATSEQIDRLYVAKASTTDFHKSSAFEAKPKALALWLRSIEHGAACMPTSSTYQKNALKGELDAIRALARRKHVNQFFPQLRELLATVGVRLVYRPRPPKCPVAGALIHRPGDLPIIGVSFRRMTDDQFWFTFFHELGHLLDDDQNRDDVHIISDDIIGREDWADEFAKSLLFGPDFSARLSKVRHTKRDVIRFALKERLTPGTVVGQLQRQGLIKQSWMNGLKETYSAEMLEKFV